MLLVLANHLYWFVTILNGLLCYKSAVFTVGLIILHVGDKAHFIFV